MVLQIYTLRISAEHSGDLCAQAEKEFLTLLGSEVCNIRQENVAKNIPPVFLCLVHRDHSLPNGESI